MICLDRVSKRYGDAEHVAVDDVSLEVDKGELAVFVGPSGCGKTTTLKMINRMIEPSAGTITISGTSVHELDVTELRRSIGYVIQRVGLFPHWTVADNIATVPRLLDWQPVEVDRRVRELAGLMGLSDDLLDRYPAALSGGQQQRVGVARALAAEPPVLLMDEPFAAVDPIVRAQLQEQLLELQAKFHKTIILVTHDVEEALRLGDRIAVFSSTGRVVQYASPEAVLRSPATDEVAAMFGRRPGLRLAGLRTLQEAIAATGVSPAPTADDAGRAEKGLVVLAPHDRVDDAISCLLATAEATHVEVRVNDKLYLLSFTDLKAALSSPGKPTRNGKIGQQPTTGG